MLGRLLGSGAQAGDISVEEARTRQDQGALLVDVREADEWAAGHAAGARHLPLSQLSQMAATLPRDRDLLIICRSGNRSARAVAALKQAGYDRAVNVSGGMIAWSQSNLPLARA